MPRSSILKKSALALVVIALIAVTYRVVAFELREHRVEQVEVGMKLPEVAALLGESRRIGAFETELTDCPPEREAFLFEGNASIFLNGRWEDYVKVGVVGGSVCDVARLGL